MERPKWAFNNCSHFNRICDESGNICIFSDFEHNWDLFQFMPASNQYYFRLNHNYKGPYNFKLIEKTYHQKCSHIPLNRIVLLLTSEEQLAFLADLSTNFQHQMMADSILPEKLRTSFHKYTLQEAITTLNGSFNSIQIPEVSKYVVRREPCTPKKIVCFGASVTAQKYSYVDSLQSHMPNVELIKKGYGGCHINQATWLLQDVLDQKPDVCILDWITSLVSTRTELEKYLDSIVHRLKEHSITPIFLYLYRKSIDDFKDTIQVYESVANYYSITSIHMYRVIQEHKNPIDTLFRDECHTTFEGSQFYGGVLAKAFESPRIRFIPRMFPENPYDAVQSFPIREGETMEFNGIHYTKIQNTLDIDLPENSRILAIHILYHPGCGFLEIGGRKFQSWDANCYYIRRGYQNIFHSGNSITVLQDSFETPCKYTCVFPTEKFMWISEVLYLTSSS